MALQINIFAFKNRFPELEPVADDVVQNHIDLSLEFHDASVWSVKDYPLAVMLWAAHMVILYKQQTEHALDGGGPMSSDLFASSIGFGERHVSYGQKQKDRSADYYKGPGEQQLDDTEYGSLYMQVRARNIIPCLIV